MLHQVNCHFPPGRSKGELSEEELEVGPSLDSDASSGEEEDVIGNLKNFFTREEALGADVRDETAAIMNGGLRSMVSLEREKELTRKITRPANCEGPVVPKINRDIRDILLRASIDADLGVQCMQFLLHKGITPIIRLMDNLLRREDKANLKLAAEAFKILAFASCQLSQKRKELVALDLEQPFNRLCSASNLELCSWVPTRS